LRGTFCCTMAPLLRSLNIMFNPVEPDPDWVIGKYGLLNVQGELRDGRTVLEPKGWRIPFQWQGYHYQDHDDQPFLLLVNSGGGFVEGDVSHFHAMLGAKTRTLITTTAASKFYKSIGGGCTREIVDIQLGPDSLLEYYPDEAIPFEHSRVERITRVTMTASSRLFATDMLSAGRVHFGSGESFKFDSLLSSFEIRLDDRTLALDRLAAMTPVAVDALHRLWRGALHLATVFVYAPDLPIVEDTVDALRGSFTETELGVSRIGNLLIVRLLSKEAWQAHEAIFSIWQAVRPGIAAKPARPIRKC
jgi:urease accessory protein